jgi:hypothetical protein
MDQFEIREKLKELIVDIKNLGTKLKLHNNIGIKFNFPKKRKKIPKLQPTRCKRPQLDLCSLLKFFF